MGFIDIIIYYNISVFSLATCICVFSFVNDAYKQIRNNTDYLSIEFLPDLLKTKDNIINNYFNILLFPVGFIIYGWFYIIRCIFIRCIFIQRNRSSNLIPEDETQLLNQDKYQDMNQDEYQDKYQDMNQYRRIHLDTTDEDNSSINVLDDEKYSSDSSEILEIVNNKFNENIRNDNVYIDQMLNDILNTYSDDSNKKYKIIQPYIM